MISPEEFRKEEDYLALTCAFLKEELARLGRSQSHIESEIYEQRRYMWQELPHSITSEADAIALTTQSEMMRETEVRWLEKDRQAALYTKMLPSPYFGRVDFTESGHPMETLYIGLANVMDPKTYRMWVCDWRAPVAALFYEKGCGPVSFEAPDGTITGEVTLLRQYKIEDSKLLRVLDSDIRIEDDILQEALSQSASAHMRAIVSSIQKEQNAIIRDGMHSLSLVLGPAGSGKTSIALHRVAYLLYRDKDRMTSDNILIFAPNDVFSAYISEILPSLGEETVPQTTFQDLIAQYAGRSVSGMYEQIEFLHQEVMLPGDEVRHAALSLKGSFWFLEFAKKFCQSYCPSFCDIYFTDKLVISAATLRRMYKVDYAHLTPAKRLEAIRVMIFHRLGPTENAFKRALRQELVASNFDEWQLRSRCRQALDETMLPTHEQIKQCVELDLLSVYRSLLYSAIDAWPDAPADTSGLKASVDALSDTGTLFFEDGVGILLVGCLMGAIPKPRKIHHVVLDEVQDFSPAQHAVIAYLFSDSKLTMLGDIGQLINPKIGMIDGEQILSIYNRPDSYLHTLTKSYRSTLEINQFAARLLPETSEHNFFERHGKPVSEEVFATDREMRFYMVNELRNCEGKPGTTAVLARSTKDAERLYQQLKRHLPNLNLLSERKANYQPGLWIIPVSLAKGLEFDRVLLADCQKYKKESDRGLLYVACTRAMHELTLCSVGEPSPLLQKTTPVK